MLKHVWRGIAVSSLAFLSTPAAAQGVITITQQKALAGGVTPGDAPGFPITISQPGHYRFGGEIEASARKVGIQIDAPDVLIDLNGFRLYGGSPQGAATTGILGVSGNATIRNGTITRFGRHGIRQTIFGWVVENMRIESNGGYGINGGADLRVKDSWIGWNEGGGITTFNGIAGVNGLAVRDSSIVGNGGDGVVCQDCLVEGNVIRDNDGRGVFGQGITVLGNTITSNTGFGAEGIGIGGFGNNFLALNNGGGANPQVKDLLALHPNVCHQVC